MASSLLLEQADSVSASSRTKLSVWGLADRKIIAARPEALGATEKWLVRIIVAGGEPLPLIDEEEAVRLITVLNEISANEATLVSKALVAIRANNLFSF
jgi:hypothetical protein